MLAHSVRLITQVSTILPLALLFLLTSTLHAQDARLEGLIFDSETGVPLERARVALISRGTSQEPPVVTDSLVTGIVSYETVTGTDGRYRIDEIQADRTYILQVKARGYESLVVRDYTLQPGEIREADFSLAPGDFSNVSGVVVFDDSSTPVENALVFLISPNATTSSGRTNAQGRYTALVGNAQDYLALVRVQGADSAFIYTEFFDDAASPTEAIRFTVDQGVVTQTNGTLITSIDFSIPNLAQNVTTTVSGRVTDTDNQAIADAEVTVTNYFGYWDLQRFTARTDSDGRYTVTIEGPYLQRLTAWAEKTGFMRQYYDSASVAYKARPIPIDIENPTAESIDFVLTPLEVPGTEEPSVTGTVTNTSEAPLSEVLVMGVHAETEAVVHAYTDADGRYVLPDVQDGAYFLLFTANRYEPAFAGGGRSWTEAQAVSVSDGVQYDARLAAIAPTGGSQILTGHVWSSDRTSKDGALVSVEDESGRLLGYDLTDADGVYRIENLSAGVVRLRAETFSGEQLQREADLFADSPVRVADLTLERASPVSTEQAPRLPAKFKLDGAYPNPFNPSTVIAYSLTERADVTLTVFDVLGRTIATLVEGPQSPGAHTARFEATGLPSGLYFYRLSAAGQNRTQSMVLLR